MYIITSGPGCYTRNLTTYKTAVKIKMKICQQKQCTNNAIEVTILNYFKCKLERIRLQHLKSEIRFKNLSNASSSQ